MRLKLIAALIGAMSADQASSAPPFAFGAPTQFATGAYPTAVAIGDVTGDGRPDLVVMNNEWAGFPFSAHVLIREQMANGTLAPAVAVRYGTDYNSTFDNAIELVDLNGDGASEIAVGATGKLSILTRQTNGSFALSQTTYSDYEKITSLVAMDANLDGHPDLASYSESSGTSVRVFLGNGAGGVSSHYSLDMASLGVTALSSGDINGDGLMDLAAGHFGSNGGWDLVVRHQSNNGVLGPRANFDLPDWLEIGHGIETGDFTGDGRTDVILIGGCLPSNPASLWLFRQSPAGALGGAEQISGPCGGYSASRDVDLDGRRDVVMVGRELVVYTGAGSALAYHGTYPMMSSGPNLLLNFESIALGDLNSDSCTDAVVAEPVRGVLLATGEHCRPAADIAVRLHSLGAGSLPRVLDIELTHLGGHPVDKALVTVRVMTREKVAVPDGCDSTVQSRSYTEFVCYSDGRLAVGDSATFSLALDSMVYEDWHVTATAESSHPDATPENNSKQLKLIR